MIESEAVKLIEDAEIDSQSAQEWADLGCGSGLFSFALSSLLPEGSSILCIDKSQQNLDKLIRGGVRLTFRQTDFTTNSITETSLDGILMANSLHFVKQKRKLIQKLKSSLSDIGQFIIVEYETSRGNPWVPYPVPFADLKQLFHQAGFNHIKKIGERPSRYGSKHLYACQIKMSDKSQH